IENTIHALKADLLMHKDANLSTMKRRGILGIQFIRDRLTMAKTQVSEKNCWKVVECRTTVIPTSWTALPNVYRVAELVATLYLELLEQKEIRDKAAEEMNGLATPVPVNDTVRGSLNWIFEDR